MRRRIWVLVAVVTLVATACSSGGHHQATPTTTDPATTLPAGPNPDVIPAHITPAYVNAVFVQLNRIASDAARASLSADALTPGVIQDLRSIYSPPLYAAELNVYRAGLTEDRSNIKAPAGDRVTVVRQLLGATPTCIFASTTSDLSAIEKHPTASPASEYWELQPKTKAQDALHLNPTPWAASFNQDYLKPTTLKSPC